MTTETIEQLADRVATAVKEWTERRLRKLEVLMVHTIEFNDRAIESNERTLAKLAELDAAGILERPGK